MATALGKAGALVILIARRPEPLQATAEHLSSLGIQVTALAMDVGESEAIRSWVLNAAGINPRPPLDELTQSQWDHVLAVNLAATDRPRLDSSVTGQAIFVDDGYSST
ncbi:gluconate 5-dehydrogenase [Metarhizium acridum CQMa 102]|uniref:Gluconate 5-dehydrogenase n=1 Tax=Metarhizium acridum (strain CQMa 102) TaxID=655827 RepID=E9DV04_METAQ|nr:gluconate 5-dehydrogenase [Metarhizium acridum CQMa 102]EFY92428.1 gluconate 5-dehydrogenase [Metarhizium acridum CQMa 102]